MIKIYGGSLADNVSWGTALNVCGLAGGIGKAKGMAEAFGAGKCRTAKDIGYKAYAGDGRAIFMSAAK